MTAGKEDEIKTLVQQIGVFLASARDDGDVLRRENSADDLFNDGAGMRGIGAGLYKAGVACGDGVGQGLDGEQERIIPRAHDQRAAQGRSQLIAGGGKLRKRRIAPSFAGKTARMADHVGNLRQRQADFAHVRFVLAFAKVRLQRLGNFGLIFLDDGAQPAQRIDALVDVQRGAALIVSALFFKQQINFMFGHGVSLLSRTFS